MTDWNASTYEPDESSIAELDPSADEPVVNGYLPGVRGAIVDRGELAAERRCGDRARGRGPGAPARWIDLTRARANLDVRGAGRDRRSRESERHQGHAHVPDEGEAVRAEAEGPTLMAHPTAR